MVGPSEGPVWPWKRLVDIEVFQRGGQWNTRQGRIVWKGAKGADIADSEAAEDELLGLGLSVVILELDERLSRYRKVNMLSIGKLRIELR